MKRQSTQTMTVYGQVFIVRPRLTFVHDVLVWRIGEWSVEHAHCSRIAEADRLRRGIYKGRSVRIRFKHDGTWWTGDAYVLAAPKRGTRGFHFRGTGAPVAQQERTR